MYIYIIACSCILAGVLLWQVSLPKVRQCDTSKTKLLSDYTERISLATPPSSRTTPRKGHFQMAACYRLGWQPHNHTAQPSQEVRIYSARRSQRGFLCKR